MNLIELDRLADMGSAASYEACRRYELAVVAEARAIVAGTSDAKPQTEHLRVILGWLDGLEERPSLLDSF